MTEHEPKEPRVTITGLVIPAQWGPKGEVVAVAIADFAERTHLVLPDSRSLELMGMLHRQVTVVGRAAMSDGGEKMIKVEKIGSRKTSRRLVPTLVMAATAGLFLAGAVGTSWAQQTQPPAAAPAVKKAEAPAAQPAVKKAAKPAVKKAAVAKKPTGKKMVLKSNPKVKAMQEALNKAGFKCKADGVSGKKTRVALRKFQKSKGLKVTGKPDKATLKALGLV